MKKITVTTIEHRGKSVFMLIFEKDTELISLCKQIGAKYSSTHKGWWLVYTPESSKIIKETFGASLLKNELRPQSFVKPTKTTAYDQLKDTHKVSIKKYKEYLRSKRFAESTIKTYIHSIQLFLAFYKDRTMESLTNEDVIRFNNEYILVRKLSSSFQNQMVHPVGLKTRKYVLLCLCIIK